MFIAKNQYVRELANRIVASRLGDEDCLSALFYMIKTYRENPRAFADFRLVGEPLDLLTAFQWSDEDPQWIEYWTKINDALVNLYNEVCSEAEFEIQACADEECEAACPACEDCECDIESGIETQWFEAMGPAIKGYGLFDTHTDKVVQLFRRTESAAEQDAKDGQFVIRVVLVGLQD